MVEQIVGRQKRTDGKPYRLMTYVVQQPVDDGVLLYNTLTCSLVLLTPDEAADITMQQELIDRWFLVPQEHDDQKLCCQIHQMAALLKPAAKAITGYTILTTTGCNARCFYCFEKGMKSVSMTAETASKVVRYIMAHRGDEEVKISWFGGEPLVNAKVIDQICTELREQGVPFRSTMISNGYLFDADKVQRAKDLWQLQQVQITLDGTEQTYNRVKDYVYRGVNAFERVLQNIGLLTAAGIRVNIRLNVDQHNIGEMAVLVELLHQRFGTNEHLTVYSMQLYGEHSPEDSAELFAQRMQLKQQIAQCGYKLKRGLQKDINNIQIRFKLNEQGVPETYLNGVNVEKKIRTMEVSSRVSPVAALPFVREALVALQQEMGKEKGIVMDGRDIGTTVFPDAELKLFVTASAEVRAQRRYDELKTKGENNSYEEILKNVVERDRIDTTREVSPLKQAEDAIVFDNSNMTIDEQNAYLQEIISKALA